MDGADLELREKTEPKLEIPKEQFYKKLTPEDAGNIREIVDVFQGLGIKGGLMAVGGILEKPGPRKDIDIRVATDTAVGGRNYNKAQEKFMELRKIAEAVVGRIGGTISEIPPAIDEEFDNPSILKHEGTIQISREGFTPVEFLNTPGNNFEEEKERQNRQYSILARV